MVLNRWGILLADPTGVELLALACLVVVLLASGGFWWFYFSGGFQSFRPDNPPPSEKPGLSFPAVALVVFLVVNSLLAKPPQAIQVEQLQSRCLEGLVVWGLLVGSLLIVPGVSLKDYGIRFQGLFRQLAVGGLAFLASFLPVYALLLATSPFRSVETLHPFLRLLQSNPGAKTVFWIGLAVSIVAPFLEEMIYRVILQTSLGHWLPAGVAIPLTAAVFCLAHGWPDMIPLFPLALILGWVHHRYRSYLAVVATHALFNSWMLALALLVPSAG